MLLPPYSSKKLIMVINKEQILDANVTYTAIDDYGQLKNYEKPLLNNK
ncbi:TPA: hypothetical protein ACSPZU_003780 [Aeromonas veronii]